MAAKKTLKKAPLKRKAKKAPKKPPTKAVSKKALKEPSTATAEAAPEAAPAAVKKQSKTSFVLGFPAETPAKDVVAAGAAAGIALTEKGIYKTRYLARAKGSKTVKTAGPTAPVKAPPKAVKAVKRGPGKRGPGDGSGSAFIRSQLVSMKASEVVAAAKAKGITITPGLVYSVRQAAKKKAGKAAPSSPTGKRRGRPPAAALKPAPKAVVAAGGGDRERQLISLALDLGLGRAVELIESVRARIGSLY